MPSKGHPYSRHRGVQQQWNRGNPKGIEVNRVEETTVKKGIGGADDAAAVAVDSGGSM